MGLLRKTATVQAGFRTPEPGAQKPRNPELISAKLEIQNPEPSTLRRIPKPDLPYALKARTWHPGPPKR